MIFFKRIEGNLPNTTSWEITLTESDSNKFEFLIDYHFKKSKNMEIAKSILNHRKDERYVKNIVNTDLNMDNMIFSIFGHSMFCYVTVYSEWNKASEAVTNFVNSKNLELFEKLNKIGENMYVSNQ